MDKIIVIGAGLAGSEAAWQAAQRGVSVELYEMRPQKSTPAHKTDGFAELVCSNSLRGAGMENAVGVLKEEMRRGDHHSGGSGCHQSSGGGATGGGSGRLQPLYYGEGQPASPGHSAS